MSRLSLNFPIPEMRVPHPNVASLCDVRVGTTPIRAMGLSRQESTPNSEYVARTLLSAKRRQQIKAPFDNSKERGFCLCGANTPVRVPLISCPTFPPRVPHPCASCAQGWEPHCPHNELCRGAPLLALFEKWPSEIECHYAMPSTSFSRIALDNPSYNRVKDKT
jgi:hypothetical protein